MFTRVRRSIALIRGRSHDDLITFRRSKGEPTSIFCATSRFVQDTQQRRGEWLVDWHQPLISFFFSYPRPTHQLDSTFIAFSWKWRKRFFLLARTLSVGRCRSDVVEECCNHANQLWLWVKVLVTGTHSCQPYQHRRSLLGITQFPHSSPLTEAKAQSWPLK